MELGATAATAVAPVYTCCTEAVVCAYLQQVQQVDLELHTTASVQQQVQQAATVARTLAYFGPIKALLRLRYTETQ